MKKTSIVLIAMIILSGIIALGCIGEPKQQSTAPSEKVILKVFHAGSLSKPFSDIEKAYEAKHPNVDVQREAKGSIATIRKVTDLGRTADIIGSADYTAIEKMMFPEYADWYVAFAKNQMVIIYNDMSKYANEVNSENWYEVLTREGVELSHSNPDDDPCGYRAVIVYKLAAQYYNDSTLYDRLTANTPPKNIRSTETDLLGLLDAGELDYVFIYKSIASQHNYKFIELPPQLDLGEVEYKDFYYNGTVALSDGTVKHGAPIVYGITIPKNAEHPDIAADFVRFVLSADGQKIMQDNGQPPIVPAITNDINKVPENIKSLVFAGNTSHKKNNKDMN
ncbi:MAG: tungstate ABC transporter substrate-binding protein WtpA [Methanosarcinales archaeon]